MRVKQIIGVTIATAIPLLLAVSMAYKQDGSCGLKDTYQDYFRIGTALNYNEIMNPDSPALSLLKKQFNSVTAENAMKWDNIHPEPDIYNFGPADAFVKLGEENNMQIIGHVLVWHNQTPSWVFENSSGEPANKKVLLEKLHDHIFTVVGRYRGRIHGWDVINEAVEDNGRLRQSPWLRIIGKEYIEKALQWAHEADPEAELYYNDFNMWYPGKRKEVIQIIKDLQSRNIPVHGIGLQGHWGLDYPPLDELEESIIAYGKLGLHVLITELDLDMLPSPGPYTGADIDVSFELRKEIDPWTEGLPDSMETVIANRYVDFFRILKKHKNKIDRVTFWGIQDGSSWRNNWPVRGRTAYPLLFDRNYQPKPAFNAVLNLISEESI